MITPINKAALSGQRRHLLERMQKINFGRIENLKIHKGEPQFDPPPQITKDIKLGSENDCRPELDLSDFLLKQEVIELFSLMDEQGECEIGSLEVKHGIPFRVLLEETA